jgi:hypothetical protein
MAPSAGWMKAPDHPDTLTTHHELAYRRGEAGDTVSAATTLEQVLQDQLRVQDPNRPLTTVRGCGGSCLLAG